jgi:hypothetical protein
MWASYQSNRDPFFKDYKALYTVLYGTNGLKMATDAQAMPDVQERGEASETALIELKPIAKTCCRNYQMLKGYIRSAFTNEDVWKPKFEAAGSDYYEGAYAEDWESVSELNQRMHNFIDANSVALLAGNNMPATFTAKVDDDADAFTAKYGEFTGSSSTSTATDAKITANNAAYKFVMNGIAADAPVVFEDETLRALFIFNTRLEEINPKERGVKGGVEQSGTNEPLANAVLTFKKIGEPIINVECDDDSKYKTLLSDGDYDWTVACPNHTSKNGSIKIDGTMKTMNIELDIIP